MTKSKLSLYMMILFFLLCLSEALGYAGELEENLFKATKSGNVSDVCSFLAKGADANAKSNEGATALMWASIGGLRM